MSHHKVLDFGGKMVDSRSMNETHRYHYTNQRTGETLSDARNLNDMAETLELAPHYTEGSWLVYDGETRIGRASNLAHAVNIAASHLRLMVGAG
jgi:hypothetical protein